MDGKSTNQSLCISLLHDAMVTRPKTMSVEVHSSIPCPCFHFNKWEWPAGLCGLNGKDSVGF